MPRPRPGHAHLELAVCLAIFGAASFFSGNFYLPVELAGVSALSAITFWWGLQWGLAATSGSSPAAALVGSGMALLAGAMLAYSQITEPLPVGVLAVACLAAGIGSVIIRSNQGKTLIVGTGPLSAKIAQMLGRQSLSVDDNRLEGLWQAVEERAPAAILIDPSALARLSPRFLLDCKIRGIKIESTTAAYERLYRRLFLAHLRLDRLLWPETLRANRPVMAVQAIYSNLLGLLLLLLLLPLLLLLTIISRLEAGPGPWLESVECAGFQNIPFFRKRFRTRRAGGSRTWSGALIETLGIVGLPQILNVVRGEMAVFGPAPVRLVWAEYLDALSPLYSRRLGIKPGIFSWAAVHPASVRPPEPQEEHLRLGYDLYYFENGSLLLDAEILIRSLWPFRRRTEKDGDYGS